MSVFNEDNIVEFCINQSVIDKKYKTILHQNLNFSALSIMEWHVLGVVSMKDNKPHSITSISHELNVTLPQITLVANSLVSAKLIKQKVVQNDRRGKHLSITPKGARLLDKINSKVFKSLGEWYANTPLSSFHTYLKVINKLAGK